MRLIFILVLLLTYPGFHCFAIDPLILGDSTDELWLNEKSLLSLKNCEDKLTIHEVLKTNDFNSNSNSTEPGCNNYWLKFTIQNNSRIHKSWVLEVVDPHIEHVSFYSEEGALLGNAGFSEFFDEREFFHKNFVFRVPLDRGETKTFFLKMNSTNGFGFGTTIRGDTYFTYYSLNEYLLLGMYYGIILIMALYNFFIFFSVRERIYLYYVFYALACGLTSFAEDGIGFQYLWPEYPRFNSFLSHFGPFILLSTFLPYASSFLKIREKLPGYIKFLVFGYTAYLLTFLIHFSGWADTRVRFVVFLIPFLLVYIAALKIYKQGYKPAKFFIMGYSLIVISLGVFLMRMYNLINPSLLVVYCFNIGFVTEVVVLSLALGARLRLEKNEKEENQKKVIEHLKDSEQYKDNLNRQLEEKIIERTKELQASNEKLNNANNKLNAANDQLKSAFITLEHQAKEIEKMNSILDADNKELKVNLKELSKARVMFKEVNFDEFSKIYPSDETCLKYLSQIKWEKKFSCRKCSNENFSEGRTPFSRRCSKCRYEESPTAYTIFHRNRIPLTKAFYMVFLVSTNKKDVSSEELSRKLEIRQKTCWTFKQKIIKALHESSGTKFKAENWGSLFLNMGEK